MPEKIGGNGDILFVPSEKKDSLSDSEQQEIQEKESKEKGVSGSTTSSRNRPPEENY